MATYLVARAYVGRLTGRTHVRSHVRGDARNKPSWTIVVYPQEVRS